MRLAIDEHKMHKDEEISDKTRRYYKTSRSNLVSDARSIMATAMLRTTPSCLQAYADWLTAHVRSASTVHTYLVEACRGFGVPLETISTPRRVVSGNTHSRETKAVDARGNAQREASSRLWDFAAAIGIRRRKYYAHLHGDDFVYDESGYPCVRVKWAKAASTRSRGSRRRI